MAGDTPANEEILVAQATPPGGSLADQILGRRPPGNDTTTPPKPGTDAQPVVPKPSDTPRPADVPAAAGDGKDVVLKLSYKDAQFDDKIWKTVRYNTLEITDFPPGASIKHWADKDGYFFYLTGADGKMLDNKLHHYPGNLAKITVNGATQDLVAERRKVSEAVARRNDINLQDGVLTLKADDPKFDEKLTKISSYDTINITGLPAGAKFTHGMDDKGFFFNAGDGRKHYYPLNAKAVAIDGTKTVDLNRSRYEAVEAYSQGSFGGFKNWSRQRDPLSNAQQVMNFAFKMDRHAGTSLEVLDRNLTEAIKSPDAHPHFKYLLANVKLAEAMSAVRARVLAGQEINHPSVLQKIDEADVLLDQVIKDSDGSLRQIGRGFPKGNAPLMPLMPYAPYDTRDPNRYYSFWGGTWDQAGFMKPGLKFIRGLVESNALGLPPVRP